MKINRLLIVFLVIVILGLGGTSYYFYSKFSSSKKLLANPQALVDQQGAQIVAQVAKLMDLPVDETPTVATVMDASKLKDQQFFANALNDDKVLIYALAKKAILYRPSTNKIVEVGPLTTEDTADMSGKPTPTPTKVKKVVEQLPEATISGVTAN